MRAAKTAKRGSVGGGFNALAPRVDGRASGGTGANRYRRTPSTTIARNESEGFRPLTENFAVFCARLFCFYFKVTHDIRIVRVRK